MNKEILEKLIEKNFSQQEIADELNKSKGSVRYWLKKYFLKTKKFYNKKKYQHLSKEENEIRIKQQRVLSVSKRRKKIRLKAIDFAGGCCQHCGYKKYSEVLEFHHINPNNKEFELNLSQMGQKWDKIEKEINKCILLCANCHREEHVKLLL